MNKERLELVVGLFVLIGIACLTYLSVKLGKLEFIGGDHYLVTAEFHSASGLKPGASVEIAGVEVGRIKAIGLSEDRALITMAVNNDVKLFDDTIASVKSRGIIGEKFLSISPGGAGAPLQAGDKIRETESGLDLEDLVSQFIHGNVETTK